MPDPLLKYKIGIGLIPKIGPVLTKRLIAYTGSIEGVFREKKRNLLKVPGIGEKIIDQIIENNVLEKAEKEIDLIEKKGITIVFYLDENYPHRLKQCEDAPVVLFIKGNTNLDANKSISVVGTRSATAYGKECCNKLIADLVERHQDLLLVSGLAYGIDICAHKAAIKYNLDNVAVLGHGLSTIYPSAHRSVAGQITQKGALISEFLYEESPEAPNFVKRNRIIAGLSDVTIVIESGVKGGALITADLANSYNRDVFALPGRADDKFSAGCNRLIKTNKASLIENVDDIEYLMGWQKEEKSGATQTRLFVELTEDEKIIMDIFNENAEISIDQIALNCNMPMSKVSFLLINLEFNGLVKCYPGKMFKRVGR